MGLEVLKKEREKGRREDKTDRGMRIEREEDIGRRGMRGSNPMWPGGAKSSYGSHIIPGE